VDAPSDGGFSEVNQPEIDNDALDKLREKWAKKDKLDR
jgi:hypothetical protein